MISEKIIDAYSKVFKSFYLVDGNEALAREAIQETIFRIVLMDQKGVSLDAIENPEGYFIYSSKNNARSIRTNRGNRRWLYYDGESIPGDGDEEPSLVDYNSIVNTTNLGQISSVDHSIELKEVKEAAGEDFDFVLKHLDFSDGSRLRGAKNNAHRPKIFDSDADRYRMAYIRKKLRKQFK